MLKRQFLDRRRRQLLSPSLGPVRLGYHRDQVLTTFDKLLQGGAGEIRGSHEYNPRLCHNVSDADSAIFRYLRWNSSRLSGER